MTITARTLSCAVGLWPLLALGAGIDHAVAQLTTQVFASGFSAPVEFVQDPSDSTVQYVVEQGGRIRVIAGGVLQATDFLNLTGQISSGGERGLLGLAFPPDYATSGRFFVNFTNPDGHTVIARFRRSSNPLVADLASRFDLRWSGVGFIQQPYANHKGGHIAFGPDGYLYIGMGDGGSGNDPSHLAQNPTSLLGKFLRIDVGVADNDRDGYRVPSDNPFLDGNPVSARPEIWSFGLRNPWKFSFDDVDLGGTGALLIADVGQASWEELDHEPRNRGGQNYGWRNREGAHDNVVTLPPAYLPLVDPIHEYSHAVGSSITGGFVYRGALLGAGFNGRYFFGDFVAGRVWSIALIVSQATGDATAGGLIEHTGELGGTSTLGNISSFGVDAAGELYVVSYSRGLVLKVLPCSGCRARRGDFDGDKRVDPTVWRAGSGVWYSLPSSTNYTASQMLQVQWGAAQYGDVPVPGDYDGDGKTDPAVWRAGPGIWYVLRSSSGHTQYSSWQWGGEAYGDVPVPADYDGDGKTDPAVWRQAYGIWYVLTSSSNYTQSVSWQWGGSAFTDVPVPADYDGDGKADPAVWRANVGMWYALRSSKNYSTATTDFLTVQWGGDVYGDTPVVGDYDGDGKADPAVWRAGSGVWFVLKSTAGYSPAEQMAIQWGGGAYGDRPMPGDYDGDGKSDPAVWRAGSGMWYALTSSSNYSRSNYFAVQWGGEQYGDLPQ